jgi:hypothetical protein
MYVRKGETSGRWTALEDMPYSQGAVACRCECGTVKRVEAKNFKHGNSKSCGCLNRARVIESNLSHGLRHHPLYCTWHGMMARCHNPKAANYEEYGGRGIEVCERWRDAENGLRNFIEDMGLKPAPEFSLERKDNNGNYEPSNCCWATKREQSANVRPRATQKQLRELRAENSELRVVIADLAVVIIDNLGEEALPPAYTEFVGALLMGVLEETAVAA